MMLALNVVFRTVVLYLALMIATRLMGKRQIGQLQAFEFVVAVVIAELAAIPMTEPSKPLWMGLLPVGVVTGMQILFSWANLKSRAVRRFICGTPSVLVENGRVIEAELKRNRFNIDELLEEIRLKDVPDLSDVEFAILETNGRLSVIPKSQARPATPGDLNLFTRYEGLPLTLVVDGEMDHENLQRCGYTPQSLCEALQQRGVQNISEVLIASLNSAGDLFVQVRGSR